MPSSATNRLHDELYAGLADCTPYKTVWHRIGARRLLARLNKAGRGEMDRMVSSLGRITRRDEWAGRSLADRMEGGRADSGFVACRQLRHWH
jgi:hypothetical protein